MPQVKMKAEQSDKVIKPKRIEVALPTEFTDVEENLSAFTFFVYGHQKIGKTSLSTKFESPLHIMFEPGAKRYKTKEVRPANWKEFEDYVTLLDTQPNDFKTVVIDTVDICWEYCADHVCKQAGVEMLKDIGFGDGYTRAGTAFRNAMIKIANKYGNNKQDFFERGKKYNAERLDYGDASIKLYPLPRIAIIIILWEQDDEFPARSDILLDASCEEHLSADMIWSLAMLSALIML